MRAFICDGCREAQIVASGGMEMVVTSYTGPALVYGELGAGFPASPDPGVPGS